MPVDASAYTVLGLEPGADWSSIERAYKALIKVHHPDRPGGDGDRAAEINRAYRELRRLRAPEQVSELFIEPEISKPPRRSGRWLAAVLALAGAAALFVLLTDKPISLVDEFRGPSAPLISRPLRAAAVTAPREPMTEPLVGYAIESGVADAMRLAASGNEQAMAQASDSCHGALSVHPTLARLDRCAAFDDAIVQLEDRDPWRDDGPFSTVAVSGRQMSGGNLLSNDYLAIEARLDRIRLTVEASLSPSPPPEPPLPANQVD